MPTATRTKQTQRNPCGAGRKPLADPRVKISTTIAQSAIDTLASYASSPGVLARALFEATARGIIDGSIAREINAVLWPKK